MKFTPTKLSGAYIIEMEKREDERGFLTRIWDRAAFAAQGITFDPPQAYASVSKQRGTLRGLHYQIAPAAEAKLVCCLRGKIFEVIVDLRPSSATYRQWQGFAVDSADASMLYVPEYVAHGFLTLTDDVEIINFSGAPYTSDLERGIRYDDPAFAIAWPEKIINVSAKDANWPDFKG